MAGVLLDHSSLVVRATRTASTTRTTNSPVAPTGVSAKKLTQAAAISAGTHAPHPSRAVQRKRQQSETEHRSEEARDDECCSRAVALGSVRDLDRVGTRDGLGQGKVVEVDHDVARHCRRAEEAEHDRHMASATIRTLSRLISPKAAGINSR